MIAQSDKNFFHFISSQEHFQRKAKVEEEKNWFFEFRSFLWKYKENSYLWHVVDKAKWNFGNFQNSYVKR